MRLTATLGVALAASLCFTLEHASAQSCQDDGTELLRDFVDAREALETKGCSELDQFISTRALFADFLDCALENGCSKEYVKLTRILLSAAYNKKPPADCAAAWKTTGGNRQVQYDAIAVVNGDMANQVFIDDDAVVTKQSFWHDGNHTVGLGVQRCRRTGADAVFAELCAEGKEASELATYSFDATMIDPERIDVTEKSALTLQTGKGVRTPEEFVRAMTRRDPVADATSIVLHCLPDTLCVQTSVGDVKMNLLKLYCDPEANCNDVLSHIVDVIAMMRRPPH